MPGPCVIRTIKPDKSARNHKMLPAWRLFHTQGGRWLLWEFFCGPVGHVGGYTHTQGGASICHLALLSLSLSLFGLCLGHVVVLEFFRPCVAYLNKRQCNWHLTVKCEWGAKEQWGAEGEEREWWATLEGGLQFFLSAGSQRTRNACLLRFLGFVLGLCVYFHFHLPSPAGRRIRNVLYEYVLWPANCVI